MNELMDLPIFHDQRSSDKQIQIKTMHNYYSVYSIQYILRAAGWRNLELHWKGAGKVVSSDFF